MFSETLPDSVHEICRDVAPFPHETRCHDAKHLGNANHARDSLNWFGLKWTWERRLPIGFQRSSWAIVTYHCLNAGQVEKPKLPCSILTTF